MNQKRDESGAQTWTGCTVPFLLQLAGASTQALVVSWVIVNAVLAEKAHWPLELPTNPADYMYLIILITLVLLS